MINIEQTLRELTSLSAVSGFENLISESLKPYFEKFCDEVYIDKYFNVTSIIRGSSEKPARIMVTAHSDEIGFLVSGIEKNGFLKISNIGGIDPRVMLAQEVVIHGKAVIPGVIGAKPPHLLNEEDKKKTVKIKELSVDTGLSNEELNRLVTIGDMVTLKPQFSVLAGEKISAKSLDNRSGLCAMLYAMECISARRSADDIYFVATTQEEFELTGAVTSSFNLNADLAVVIDTCHGDMAGAPKEETYPLGKGPAIGVGPILSRNYTKKLIETAENANIAYQTDVESGDTGTEAWATQVSGCGIPTVMVSIPVRYMHTPVEVVKISDIADTGRLVAEFMNQLQKGVSL